MLLGNEEIIHTVACAPLRMLKRAIGRSRMNPAKQHKKLHKLQSRAEECLTRGEAQKILKKAAKAQRKLEKGPSVDSDIENQDS